MNSTGKFATNDDLKKLRRLASQGWHPGETMIVFSVGEGIRKDQSTVDVKKECHKLALAYGLPEIEGYYGISEGGEFVQGVEVNGSGEKQFCEGRDFVNDEGGERFDSTQRGHPRRH